MKNVGQGLGMQKKPTNERLSVNRRSKSLKNMEWLLVDRTVVCWMNKLKKCKYGREEVNSWIMERGERYERGSWKQRLDNLTDDEIFEL